MRLRKIAILGPGLLGGSVALALEQLGGVRFSVWARREEPLSKLRESCPSSSVLSTDLSEVVAEADLIVLATPVGVMESLMHQLASITRLHCPNAIVTDVGSVKASVVQAAERAFVESSLRFVGSHPMAGSELSGLEAARADLFQGALCLQTPTADSDALRRVVAFWESLGCRCRTVGALEHDIILGSVSHFPHLLAAILVQGSIGAHPEWAAFAGKGLEDSSRIASGEAPMWAEILMDNRQAVLQALESTQTQLNLTRRFLQNAEKADLERFLLEAKQLRDTHIVLKDGFSHGANQG